MIARTHTIRRAAAAGLVLIAVNACHPTEPIIRDRGQIAWSAGGCFRIETATKAYQPLSFPSEFAQAGITVEFEAVSKPTFNTCQAGEVIELLSIHRLP